MQAQSRRAFLNFIQARMPATADSWLHVNRTAMACRFEVTVPASEQEGVAAAQKALNEIDALEAQLTVFRDSSEVSSVNRHAAIEPVRLKENLFELLVLCKSLFESTEGAFDITSGPLTRCWGFLRREGRLPESGEIERAKALVGSQHLLLDEKSQSVQFSKPGIEINLGSIGKGYALDCVRPLLSEKIRTALLNAGSSSIVAIGAGESGRGWLVGLRDPRSKGSRMGSLRLRDCAMSTSGSEEQFFEHEGKRYGHIIDPRTGWPASEVTSVTVVAQSAAISDALATAFYVAGRDLAEKYCATHENVVAIILERDSKKPIVVGNNRQCEITV
jgi:thiamine biosynthesis lipoprotein